MEFQDSKMVWKFMLDSYMKSCFRKAHKKSIANHIGQIDLQLVWP